MALQDFCLDSTHRQCDAPACSDTSWMEMSAPHGLHWRRSSKRAQQILRFRVGRRLDQHGSFQIRLMEDKLSIAAATTLSSCITCS
jgi:hypothetical protein